MSSSQSGFFIPVIFPDEDDESNNFSAPFMGHGGFILVNPNTNVATCYEYGNTQTNPDPTRGRFGIRVKSGHKGIFR